MTTRINSTPRSFSSEYSHPKAKKQWRPTPRHPVQQGCRPQSHGNRGGGFTGRYGHCHAESHRGKLVATINALGYRTTNVFDLVGRQLGLVDPKGNRTTFAFDAVGNQTLMQDALNNRTTFAYDAANQQNYKHDPRGFRISYAYDANSQMTQKRYSDGTRVTFAYDPLGNRTLALGSLGRYTSFLTRGMPR